MSPISTSTSSFATATTVPPMHSTSPPSHLTVGLAFGLVFCPVVFVAITIAFLRVSRQGDLFSRLPTARLRRESAQRDRDYAKFMATVSGSAIPRGPQEAESATNPLPPPHTPQLAHPPPVYTLEPALPPYDTRRQL